MNKTLEQRLSILEKRIGVEEDIDWEKRKSVSFDLSEIKRFSRSDPNFKYLDSIGYINNFDSSFWVYRDPNVMKSGTQSGLAGKTLTRMMKSTYRSYPVTVHRSFLIISSNEEDFKIKIATVTGGSSIKVILTLETPIELRDWALIWKTIADYVRKSDKRYQ